MVKLYRLTVFLLFLTFSGISLNAQKVGLQGFWRGYWNNNYPIIGQAVLLRI